MTKQEKAIQFIKEDNYEEAAKLMVEIIDEEPDNPVAYINFGNLLMQMKQFEESERCFLKAIALDDQTATAFYSLGNLYYENELYQQSEKMYQQSIRLGLEDSDVYFMLGMTYVKRGDHQLAIPFLQRASELHADVETLFQYGLALAQASFIDEAATILHKVIKEKNDHADALYNLGIIKVHRKEHTEAIEYLKKALAAQPDHKLAENALKNIE